MRAVFMGTPEFALPSLRATLDGGHEIAAVYTQPPRPAGRGQKQRLSPVHAFARACGLDVRTPVSLRCPEDQSAFAALNINIGIVVAYGTLLPKPILEAPRLGCVNVHASLLPRWRGCSPIHRAILAGDKESGVTIMQMDEGLDTGPMLLSEKVPITPETDAASLHGQLAERGADLLLRALDGLERGALTATPQPESGAIYAKKLSRAESRIDWSEPAESIVRKTRALNPWPGLWFQHEGCRIRLLKAQAAAETSVETGVSAAPGTVLAHPLTVACGGGALRLIEMQRAGKCAMTAEELLRGFDIPIGAHLRS